MGRGTDHRTWEPLQGADDSTRIRAVTFATTDGYETFTVDVDYRTPATSHASGGSLLPSQ